MTNRNPARGENTTRLKVDLMADRRLYAILARYFFTKLFNGGLRKKKGPKKKERGGLWKLTPLMEIRKERGFPQRLEKDFAKNAQLFHSYPQGPTAINQPTGILIVVAA